MATITSSGITIPVKYLVAKLTHDGYKQYLKELTVKFTPRMGAPKITKMYEIVRDARGEVCLVIPRGDIFLHGFESVSKMGPPRRCENTPEFVGTLRPSQQIVVNHVLEKFTDDAISKGNACIYLELKAGFGKTFVAMAVCSKLKLRAAYVVPRRKLATQGLADACCVLKGNPPLVGCQDGRFAKKISSVPENEQTITFFVVNSFLKLTTEELRRFSLIILDEAHMYHSEARRKIFKMCRHAVLGMTATPECRVDGADAVVIRELGPIVHALDLPNFAYEPESAFRGTVKIIKYFGPDDYAQNLTHESTDMIFVHYMYEQFAADKIRTNVLVKEITNLLEWRGSEGQKHCVFVFAEEKNNLTVVRDALLATNSSEVTVLEDILDENAMGMFVGGTSDTAIDAMTKNCRVFFATYPFAGTGVSIPRATAEVFVTPRKANMDQIVGRITRTGGDTSIERVVVDLVDAKTALAGQYRVRAATYRSYGFAQQHVRVHAEELED